MVKLKILHFNDVHSRFEELAMLASVAEALRDENTLILDAGDTADFARVETEGTCGVISSAILNEMSVDARVFGNNEGFSGKENGRIISESSWCPVVTCNMYDMEGRRLAFVDDAAILERSSVRILVVGVTAPYNVFYNLFEIDVRDPETEVRRVLEEYQRIPYDVLLILSHLGIEGDRRMASRIPNVDVIVGGHSHVPLAQPVVENGTIICQAGVYGKCLGELVIDFDKKERIIRTFNGRLIPADQYAQHPGVMKLIELHSKIADRNLSKELFSINVSLDHSLTEENAMGNVLADALRDIVKAEIGIINSGVLTGGIQKGKVTRKLLHLLCPSPLNPTYMQVKGVDLRATLEKSLLKEFQLGDGSGEGSRTKYLGGIQVSSNVQVRVSSNSVRSITIGGEDLEDDKEYSVGTSDFLQRGTGYADMARNTSVKYRPEFLRDVLQIYLRKKSSLRAAFKKRFLLE